MISHHMNRVSSHEVSRTSRTINKLALLDDIRDPEAVLSTMEPRVLVISPLSLEINPTHTFALRLFRRTLSGTTCGRECLCAVVEPEAAEVERHVPECTGISVIEESGKIMLVIPGCGVIGVRASGDVGNRSAIDLGDVIVCVRSTAAVCRKIECLWHTVDEADHRVLPITDVITERDIQVLLCMP